MESQPQPLARLASEDVIISAPMSYAGSAQRIMRLRRRAPEGGGKLAAITAVAVVLVVVVWILVTAWYLCWGLLLVPYRLLRRGARKRKVEALRHRELMGTIQGSAAASASALIAAAVGSAAPAAPRPASPDELIADADRDSVIAELREHLLAGRLTTAEFEERLSLAHRARTRGDVAALRGNLPSAAPSLEPPSAPV
jgi:Domain of unknown function (DUF1707)